MSGSKTLWILISGLLILLLVRTILSLNFGHGHQNIQEGLQTTWLKNNSYEAPFFDLREGFWKELKTVKGNEKGWELDKELEKWEGKEIVLPGFMYVPELKSQVLHQFALSALPIASCYFCRKASLETVMEVKSTEGVKFTQKKVKLRGIFRLNREDSLGLPYQLENAVLLD